MTRLIFVLTAAGALSAPEIALAQNASGPEVQRAVHEFVGLWRMTPIAPLGTTGEARLVRFRPDQTYTTYAEDGAELWSGTFSLDPSASPKVWDHRSYRMLEGDPSSDILGVYEMDGDVIRVSVTSGRWDGDKWVGLPRATHLESADGYSVIEFRRITDRGG